jgi:hypothetical protein
LEAKSSEPIAVDVQLMAVHGGLRLSECVDISEDNEIVEVVVAGKGCSLPDAALSAFSVTHDAVDFVVDFVEVLAGVSHTSSYTKSLTQRASGHINEGYFGNGVAFQKGAFQPQGVQIILSYNSGSVEGRVEGGASVAFGEHDSVVEEVAGVFRVELESLLMEKEDCEDVCNGGGRGGVA